MFSMSKFIIIVISSLLLFSCTSIPCKKRVDIITYDTDAEIIITNYKDALKIALQENSKKSIDISKFSSGTIEITTPTFFQAIDFGEYDHWFPMKHIIVLEVNKEQVSFTTGGLCMRIVSMNRSEYDALFQDNTK